MFQDPTDYSVIILHHRGPNRLTEDEAERLACRCFYAHDHTASVIQPSKYWVRLGGYTA